MRRVLVPPHVSPTGPALGAHVHALHGETMGTTWAVKASGSLSLDTAAVGQAIQSALDTVVAQMSTWDATSDLSRFNAAPAGHWQTLPEAFFEVLQHGLDVAQRSDGACDPAAGAVVDVWGFGPLNRYDEPGFQPPSDDDVATAQQHGGWQRLQVDTVARRVRQPGGLRLDLSGIAKGFGVDEVARCLQQRGVVDFLVEVGGELKGAGFKPDGQPWWVALEAPPGAAGVLPENVAALHGLSVATSGDYRRGFDVDGVRHAHTVDPRTGRPVRNGVVSATVLHSQCVLADAWSTALTVLGADAAIAVADREGLAAHLVVRDAAGFHEHRSSGFNALCEE